jgi:hypothetical protein
VHDPQPVYQPVVVCLQGFHEGVEGIVLLPIPIELRAQLGKAVISHLRLAQQLLQAAIGNIEKSQTAECSNEEKTRNKPQVKRGTPTS